MIPAVFVVSSEPEFVEISLIFELSVERSMVNSEEPTLSLPICNVKVVSLEFKTVIPFHSVRLA